MKNKMRSLGILSQEEKEQIWGNRMSGSQAARVVNDEINIFDEFMGTKEPIDLSKVEKIQERLEMGNFMEPVIIQRAKEKLEQFKDIKITKETYELEDDDFFTANIDGYIGEDINNVDAIIEIKNTTVEDMSVLIDRYKHQIRYYSKLFDAKDGAYLIALVNGHRLEVVHFPRNKELEDELFLNINNFRTSLELNIRPSEVGKEPDLLEEVTQEDAELFEEYDELKFQEKELKKQIKEVDKKIRESKPNNFVFEGERTIFTMKTDVSNVIDKEAIIKHLVEKHNEDYPSLINQFYKKKTVTRFTMKKRKD